MKDFFTPMKIPQKWVCLLAMSFVFGQQAFSSENYVTESIAVSADIMHPVPMHLSAASAPRHRK